MQELMRSPEYISRITGIRIFSKTMESSCPIAELIAASGLSNVLQKLNPTISTFYGKDYVPVVDGGNTSGMSLDSLALTTDRMTTLQIEQKNGFVAIRFKTLFTDSNGRQVFIIIGIRGIMSIDISSPLALLQGLFPKLRFEAVEGQQDSIDEQRYVKEKKIIFSSI